MSPGEIIIILLLCLLIALILADILFFRKKQSDSSDDIKKLDSKISDEQSRLRREISDSLNSSLNTVQQQNAILLKTGSDAQKQQLDSMKILLSDKQEDMNKNLVSRLDLSEKRIAEMQSLTQQQLDSIRKTISEQLSNMIQQNERQLEKIRGTVDEKLQETLEKRITESFRQVSERLEQVYKGLGEMQSIAQGVGDLKKVLSNVKTRGILGEIQLGAILEEILAPSQYDTNVSVIPGSSERVEFAVRLPGTEDGRPVYLPIDSKFNGDKYLQLQQAREIGDKTAIDDAKKQLLSAVKKCADDISQKYISPPYTTQFAIMFLPFEGLYAEIVNSPIISELQKNFHVNIAGPSTMAAMLNSLQMGFRTLAIQKKSSEVWAILAEVKVEFDKFADVLDKTQKHILTVEQDLNTLIGTRTRQLQKRLSRVETLDIENFNILGAGDSSAERK